MNTFERFTLAIPRKLFDELLEQASAESPNECCGLLAGRDGVVTHRFPLANALSSPTRFESDPRSMFDAMKAMRKEGIEVQAVYHSHPTSEPVPSKWDVERNYAEGVMNIIVGRVEGGEWRMAAWWIDGEMVEAAEMIVV